MKSFKIYKNIRKGAMIMGLPIAMFALMMTSVIVSLLVIIFSFSFLAILLVMVWNALLYIVLTHITKHMILLHVKSVFPKAISNKKRNVLNYE